MFFFLFSKHVSTVVGSVIFIALANLFSDYVAPVCLPRRDQMADLEIGDLVTAAGWGKMNMSTDQRADILQYIAVSIPECYILFYLYLPVVESKHVIVLF